ncbi:MAG: glycoside hydrolase family 78 protein [Streptosporangiales bacterium]|nr:glycoside hydrolase family 78 protein [Streptosporangiales bacterium]
MDEVRVEQIAFEHHREPLGVGEAEPRLSWTVAPGPRDWLQAAYQLRTLDAAGAATWTGERVSSPDSVLVPWAAPPLRSRERRAVQVRVWGPDGSEPSPWSDVVAVEAGLLDQKDWSARFVAPDLPEGPNPLLRHDFDVSDDFTSARLYVTALGVYEVELNGHRVGDDVLAPGWTSYRHRLTYRTFDVTDLLRPGRNAIGALLGDGWYRGRLGWGGGTGNRYGDRVALLAQVEIRYADGRSDVVGTDASWRCAPGPVVSAGLYEGEWYDARRERVGWSEPGYDDGDWSPVTPVAYDKARLVAPSAPPARVVETVEPVSVRTTDDGRRIVDFGQNLVGFLRIRVHGAEGDTVRIRHAEVLDAAGELCVRPLRSADATDEYVLRGGGEQTWQPRFTYHGFRYAEIDGWPGQFDAADVTALVVHADMRRTGWFSCSDEALDRLHDNVTWSMRGNFVTVPTDCPQRDERFGWTGDAQVFAPTASYLYDCAGLLSSWLADLACDQSPEGYVPAVIPDVPIGELSEIPNAFAAWGDAATVVPSVLYRRFGDEGLLRRQYPSMRKWVDAVAAIAGESRLWRGGFQFGDWLDPSAPPDDPFAAMTPPDVVATAELAMSAGLVADAAGVLGEPADAARYRALADEVRAAFRAEYVAGPGRLTSDTQTAYALAVCFDLLDGQEERRLAGARLAELVHEAGYRIGTGFVGTPLVCDALCRTGHAETAYRLVLQRECPSWLYQVTMGATTIWERWDGLLPDGSLNPGEMLSFNHYAYGAVADWLHRYVAGLAPLEPGYRRLLVRPRPGGGLTHAAAGLRTPYGRAEVSWRVDGDHLVTEVVVPPNATARVDLPGDEQAVDVGSGAHHFTTSLAPS